MDPNSCYLLKIKHLGNPENARKDVRCFPSDKFVDYGQYPSGYKEIPHIQYYDDCDSSFDNLYRFKAQIESCCPGSLVVIDHHTINSKVRFRKTILCFKTLCRRVSMVADYI